MFETEEFKENLRSTISREAGRGGLDYYQTGIIDYLQNLATGNEQELMESEFRKSASERRGIPDALSSATELARTAAQIAVAEGKSTLEIDDVRKAYAQKFCRVWPFCKS